MAFLRSLRLLTLGLGMVAGAACSSPKQPGLCPGFASCGGGLEGRWDADSFCVAGDKADYANDTEPLAECKSLYLSVIYQSVVSSLDFSDATSQLAGTITYHTTNEVALTDTCALAVYGSEVTPDICTEFAAERARQGWDDPVNCGGTSICYCSSGATQGPSSVIYDRTAAKLMSSTGEALAYCVKGDTLQLEDRSQGIDIIINYKRVL